MRMVHWKGRKSESKEEKKKEEGKNCCTTHPFTVGTGQAPFMEVVAKNVDVVPQNTLSTRMALGCAVEAHGQVLCTHQKLLQIPHWLAAMPTAKTPEMQCHASKVDHGICGEEIIAAIRASVA